MKITNREKWLLAILTIAGLSYLLFTYVLAPNNVIKDTLEQENLQLKANIERLKNAPRIESDLDEQIQSAYTEIGEQAKPYFTTTQQEELILLVNDLFDVEDLRVENLSFPEATPEVINNAEFLNTDISLSFTGNYTTLMNILDSIWAFPKSIRVKQLSMNIVESGDVVTPVTPTVEPVVPIDTLPVEPLEEGTTTEPVDQPEEIIEPEVTVNGSLTLELAFYTMDSGTVDSLYTWYIDDQYKKMNPFIAYEKANATIRYIFTGEGANLFNFDRFKQFDDIEGHWMEEEIQAFLENGYVYMNNYATFGPDLPINRGEFVVLLDSVYQWTGDTDTSMDISKFRDYESFSNLDSAYAKAIQKGIQRGYIQGYDNNTIGLASPITYGEVELVMQRVGQSDSFSWEQVADNITQTKGQSSTRWTDKNATMTKAEAVYVLTYFK